MQKQTTFAAVISIFFFWGFLAASNGIFIPFCKSHFQLSQFQSQLIDATFYGGYFIGSLLLFAYTYIKGRDFVNERGYAKSFSIGLFISAAGALLMIPSLHIGSYGFILTSFFIIALGFSLQQTAANPFVILLGNSNTGAHRLNLAGGINSLGTTVGPLIVAYFLFGNLFQQGGATTVVEMKNVDILYIILAALFIALAILLRTIAIENKQTDESNAVSFESLKNPQLYLGMIAIFIYVGVEVTIQSNLGALLNTEAYGFISQSELSPYISLYWGSLMIGRWAVSAELFSSNKSLKKVWLILLSLLAYFLVERINLSQYVAGETGDLREVFYPYFIFVVALIVIAINTIQHSARMLFAFALAGVISMIAGMLTKGNTSLLFFISGGLWCSVMWPCIFAIAINNLGKFTSQGSAFLIMMILGGAVIPPLQGVIADEFGIKFSYIITPICFAYLAYYAWRFRDLAVDKNASH